MKRMTSLLGAASMMALAAGAAQAGEITGRVTESTGTVGLQGAIVRISETGQTVSSARDGSFRLSNVPAGDFTLVVDYLGADAQTRSVTLISADDQVETNFVLGADVAADDNILIIGQRGQLTSALNRQRAAAGLISVLSADAVDRLPDENVAEAARRIAGVNVLNDQGEGRFVSIRGIDPNLNTTTVNGVRLPSPEADNRQVPLDVIDSDVLSSIVISKSLTPDMSGDTIGGNIEIETLSGLDQDERLLQFSLRGIYADVVEEFGYRGSLTFADNFMDGRLGVALSISDQLRKFGSENAEVDGGWETGVSVPFPGEFENRNYDITRERTSVVFNLDFDATESTNLYLRSTYSDFSDQEYRSRVENKFEDPDYLDSSSGGGAFFDASTGDEFEVDRDIKDRLEEQTIYAIAVGGETFTGPWTLDYQLAYAYAEEAEPDRIDTGFRAKFDEGVFGVNVNDAMLPQVIFGDAAAEAAYLDASNYEFDDLEFLNGVAEDDEWSFQFNVQRDMAFGQYFGFLKSGVQYRTREKSYDATTLVYGGYDDGSGDDLTLAGFASSVEYPLGEFGPAAVPQTVRGFFNANRANFELDDTDTLFASAGDDYSASEDVFSAYLMGSVDIDALRIVAGVRVEDTQFDTTGNQIDEDLESVTSVSAENAYTDWLPSVNLRYEAAENVIVRGAYYASISRPNLAQTAPRIVIDDDDEAEAGNPDLDRQQAQNFDLMVEYYPTEDAVISGGVFYKSIDNLIATFVDDNPGQLNGADINELTTFANIDEADLLGFEFNYQQALTMLPSVLQHTLIGANYTYVDSEATLADGREITLPLQSQNVFNLMLGYDDGRLDLRAALSYRDDFIDELGGEAAEDRIALEHTQIDFSAKYDLTDNLRLYFDFKNAFDEPFRAAFRDGGVELNSQYEEYGWQTQFGFRYTFGG
ncbi:TonB-dependent receptor [Oceanicaulis alexandrii]|uniref:TonB-dependent receptor n=1 Tax=Oceanicaulis alexandrii TaxID=153233 RepID=UPI0003FC576E|nr:TonB-dependent receptor [Oceanicaulis alexandrii]